MSVSRVVKDPARVKPVEWRKSPGPDRLAKPGSAGADGPEREIADLQTRLSEMAVAAEQQSRQAYENGYRAGESAGRSAAEEEVRSAVARLADAIANVADARTDAIRRAEADTVRLAVEIARRILHRELTINTSALEALIRAALEKLQSQEVYRVRVHPDLEGVMRNCLEEAGREEGIEVIKDPVQPRGGAIFEISRGALDASIETQLSEIERGLTERLEEQL